MLEITKNDYLIMNKTEKDQDMKYLEDNISFISKIGEYKSFENYIYYETLDDIFYYLSKYKIFIDSKKNIIFTSNFIFQCYPFFKNKINNPCLKKNILKNVKIG